MKLFLDTNIVLDLLQNREPWVNDTLVLFQLAKDKELELIVSDLTFVNVVYIAGKDFDKNKLNYNTYWPEKISHSGYHWRCLHRTGFKW